MTPPPTISEQWAYFHATGHLLDHSQTALNHAYMRTSGFSDVKIPGLKPPKETCGAGGRTLRCPTDGFTKQIGGSCGRKECNRDWPGPLSREAARARWRIRCWQRIKMWPHRIQEVIVAVPRDFLDPRWGPKTAADRVYSAAWKTAHTMGAVTGLGGLHTMHIKEEYRTVFAGEANQRNELRSQTHRGSSRTLNKYDILRERLMEAVSMETAWIEYTEEYIHVHFLVFGFIRRDALPDGWFVKVNTKPIRSDRDLQNKIFYILSHGALIPGKKSLRWFGDLGNMRHAKSPYTGKPDWVHEYGYHACPLCGTVMQDVDGVDAETHCRLPVYEYVTRKRTRPK